MTTESHGLAIIMTTESQDLTNTPVINEYQITPSTVTTGQTTALTFTIIFKQAQHFPAFDNRNSNGFAVAVQIPQTLTHDPQQIAFNVKNPADETQWTTEYQSGSDEFWVVSNSHDLDVTAEQTLEFQLSDLKVDDKEGIATITLIEVYNEHRGQTTLQLSKCDPLEFEQLMFTPQTIGKGQSSQLYLKARAERAVITLKDDHDQTVTPIEIHQAELTQGCTQTITPPLQLPAAYPTTYTVTLHRGDQTYAEDITLATVAPEKTRFSAPHDTQKPDEILVDWEVEHADKVYLQICDLAPYQVNPQGTNYRINKTQLDQANITGTSHALALWAETIDGNLSRWTISTEEHA